MTTKKAELLLIVVTLAWSSSYVLLKFGMETVSPFNLIALRFAIAFVAAGIFFYKRIIKADRQTVIWSAILGITLTCVFALLLFGLQRTSVSSAGFLSGIASVFVPIYMSVFRRTLPSYKILISSLLAVVGVWMLSGMEISLDFGSVLCLLCSMVYAVYIIITSYCTKRMDAITLGVLLLGFTSLFSFILSLLFEKPTVPTSLKEWLIILTLGLVCSAFGFVAQAAAQKYASPERVGIIFTLEPVFSALFAFIVLNERLPNVGYLGAALTIAGVIVSNKEN